MEFVLYLPSPFIKLITLDLLQQASEISMRLKIPEKFQGLEFFCL